MVTNGENKCQLGPYGLLDKHLTNTDALLPAPSKSTIQIICINEKSNRLISAVQIQDPMLVYIPKAWKAGTLAKLSQ